MNTINRLFIFLGDNSNVFTPIIGMVIGIILLFAGIKYFGYKRLIENIPTSKIRSIAMGLVEIFGKVVALENNLLLSPFSNTECVYYKYTVERWVKSNDKHHWQVVNSGKTSLPFKINDNTGSVLIDPGAADFDLKSTTFSSDAGQDPPIIIKKFLDANNLKYEGFFGINYRMKYRESIIIPNESLYIIGSATDNPFKADGTAQHSAEDIMIHRGKGKLYHISHKKEKNVIKTYLMKALSGIIVGGVIIIICFNILLKIVNRF